VASIFGAMTTVVLAGVGVSHWSPSALGAEHAVQARAVQWAPSVSFIEVGDSVVWRGMSGHETGLFPGLGPPGATEWQSELGAEGFRVTFDRPGVYVYRCATHVNAGMVGAIVVGEPANLDAIEAALPEVGTGQAFLRSLLARIRRELRIR
jgi:plastocyanin